ncbi:GLUG motif-containing protein [Fibrobacter sp. UWB7]|uniref:GLUG motif-containing protein n=1 Tax=Fibrobacter sp. UWB7 TaxID=1896206 RepID=UPI0009327144|nr:GLUG motif-containing protein [Fibrobacter sp. UWB7]
MKPQFIFTVVLSLFAIHSFAANGTMKGDGSASKPFQIEDYEDLKAIGKGAYLYSSDYVLTKDIDASASKNEMCNEDGCNGFIPIGKYKDAADSTVFWGNIDGQNHTISDLMIWLPCKGDLGFISYLIGSLRNLNFDRLSVTGGTTDSRHVGGVVAKVAGVLENVHVRNGFVQGEERVGGIAGATMKLIGYSDVSSSVKNISFQGEIKGKTCVGGIVGESDLVISDAVANVDIIATNAYVGGIVGYNFGKIMNSRASGSITPAYEEVDDVGGIAGYSDRWAAISLCISEIDLLNVTRSSTVYRLDEGVGGIVGTNHGSVSESYAKGTVEGTEDVGGIAGVSYGSIQNTFALGSVKGVESVGGLVGGNAYHAYDDSHGSILNSYAANVVKGELDVGGLVGYNSEKVERSYWNTEISGLDTSAGGTGLTSAKMMKMASFAGWDALGYEEYVVDGTDTCSYYEDVGACYSPTGNFIHTWKIDEGKSFPYLGAFSVLPASKIPLAAPTSAAKWQDQPKVAAKLDVDEELFGKWLNFAQINETKDSIYHWYRIGYAVGTDTVWGTSSYMAVPNKIEISSYDELKKIGNDIAYPLVAYYELTKDIDASSSKFTPIGDSIHMFTGSFDGKNHTIKNLEIDEPNRDFVGFFGVAEGAAIKDLKFVNAKVTGSWNVGVLAGELDLSEVVNVVSIDGNVLGTSYVGGLIGATRSAKMEKVGSTGAVKGGDEVGGLIGASASVIVNAFSVNVVRGFENVGGVIGLSDQFDGEYLQQNIYSASMLKSPYDEYGRKVAKGIIGGNFFGSGEDMKSCYYDSTVAALGRIDGYSTELMLKQSTYEGFDFNSVWAIQEGKSYPYFKGMDPILPGTLKDDGLENVLAGAGTELNPYRIYKYDDLKYIGKYEYGLDAYYKLMGNINATVSFKENCNADSTVCKGFEPIGKFSGVFIGNNKIIAGLNINRPDEDSVGLFRALAKGAKVSNVVFDTASYLGESYSYGPARTRGAIRGKNYVGVLAGVDNGATVENIFIKYDVSGENYVGSLAGKKSAGSVVRSASRFLVSGKENVGGLVGFLGEASVADCYSIANVVGTKNVGGLAGYSDNATVKNSFAAGQVVGDSKWGGLAGSDNKSTYTSVYYDTTLWYVNTTAAGDLRNTTEMVKKENYEGWDFDSTWKIAADSTYPYLSWLTKPYYISKTMKEKIYPNQAVDQTMMKMAGSGTEKDPFLIKTYGDLKSIGFGKYKLSAVYRLANDIDATASRTDERFAVGGTGFKPIGKYDVLDEFCNCYGVVLGGYAKQDTGAFTGEFHGGGHSIDSLYTGFWDKEYKTVGFIDTVAKSAVVDSLTFKGYSVGREDFGMKIGGVATVNHGAIRNVDVDIVMDSVYQSAGFVFRNYGSIENVSVKGKINGGRLVSGFAHLNYGTIANAKIDAQWIGGASAAGVAALNWGTIKNVSVKANVKENSGFVGGIAGLNAPGGTIDKSSVNVDVSGQKSSSEGFSIYYEDGGEISVYYNVQGVAGLVAVDSGTVNNSTASGVINAKGVLYVGGLIAKAYGKGLKGLHASVDVVGDHYVGGLVGLNETTISECYATGNAEGTGTFSYSGAFVGQNKGLVLRSFATGNAYRAASFVGGNDGTIRQSYSTGNVEGTGGFVDNNQSVIEDCYSTGDVLSIEPYYGFGFAEINGNDAEVRGYASGSAYKDGIHFCNGLPKRTNPSDEYYYLAEACSDSLMTGKGLSDAQMKMQKSFAAFNFDSVWYIAEGVSYPLLRNMLNPPVVSNGELFYSEKPLAENIRAELLKNAFVMDSAAKKVLKLDSASEVLLDSLENEKAPYGTYIVSYRVGVLFDSDTLWSRIAKVEIDIEKTTGARVRNVVVMHSLGAVFQGGDIAVRFEIPAAAAVKFSLIDMQGRVVKLLDLGQHSAGTHFETRSVENLSRGRYIGVLQVNGKATEKVMLLKK